MEKNYRLNSETNCNLSKIFLIRHGDSFQNIFSKEKWDNRDTSDDKQEEYKDSGLTDLGIQQAIEASRIMRNKQVDIVFTSPMYRALKSTQIIFNNHPNQPNIVVLPSLREIFIGTHEIPRPVERNLSEFENFDFSEILQLSNPDLWVYENFIDTFKKESIFNLFNSTPNSGKGDYNKIRSILEGENGSYNFNESKLETVKRSKIIKSFLMQDHFKGKNIAVVSHSFFLSTLIGSKIDKLGNVKNRRYLLNCEIMEYCL